MPHAHTARVLDAWSLLRAADGRPPGRLALSPLTFGPLLPQMFVLAEAGDDWRFRMAGALLEDLHGRPLAGEAFAALWTAPERPMVRRVLEDVRTRGAPRVLACRGATARGHTALLELTLAPTRGTSGAADRCLGLYQPVSPLARLAGEAFGALHLISPAVGPPLRLVVDNTRARPLGSDGADVAER